MLALEGEHDVVLNAFELIENIKGEEQFESPRLVPYVREPETAPSR
tara:strand:- start:288 stop:425 length:138 start_codon:yes stop_codon:yes gene_type:complete